MPKPIPEYIPDEIKEKATALGLGAMEYSEHIGLNPGRLYSFFQTSHRKLRPYKLFADYAGVTLDEFLRICESGELRDFIEALRISKSAETEQDKPLSVADLERGAGVGQEFISQKLRGRLPKNLDEYFEVSKALGWTVHRLAEHCC